MKTVTKSITEQIKLMIAKINGLITLTVYARIWTNLNDFYYYLQLIFKRLKYAKGFALYVSVIKTLSLQMSKL